jgi:hypothetical protein
MEYVALKRITVPLYFPMLLTQLLPLLLLLPFLQVLVLVCSCCCTTTTTSAAATTSASDTTTTTNFLYFSLFFYFIHFSFLCYFHYRYFQISSSSNKPHKRSLYKVTQPKFRFLFQFKKTSDKSLTCFCALTYAHRQ